MLGTDAFNSLVAEMRRRERVLSILAIIGSFIGGCGLILLSVFDTKRHPSLHRVFLLIFILGVGLSAIFSVMEVGSIILCNMSLLIPISAISTAG